MNKRQPSICGPHKDAPLELGGLTDASQERAMIKACALAALVAALCGCAVPATAWRGGVRGPTEKWARFVARAMEAGAAFAAAAAIREMIRTNPFPNLFWGCASPEQGLDAVVFTGPTPGLYYVVVDQRFDRCQGPRVRVLDGWYVYAVTPQGEVVAEADSPPPPSTPTPQPEQTPPPAAPPSTTEGDVPAPAPSPPDPSPAPEAPPPAEPSPTSPPPSSQEPSTP